MTPRQENAVFFCSSQQLPCLSLGPLKGFLSSHGAIQGPSTRLVRCFRNYRDTRTPSGVPLGAEVPGHHEQQLTQTLIVRLLKIHFSTIYFLIVKEVNRMY